LDQTTTSLNDPEDCMEEEADLDGECVRVIEGNVAMRVPFYLVQGQTSFRYLKSARGGGDCFSCAYRTAWKDSADDKEIEFGTTAKPHGSKVGHMPFTGRFDDFGVKDGRGNLLEVRLNTNRHLTQASVETIQCYLPAGLADLLPAEYRSGPSGTTEPAELPISAGELVAPSANANTTDVNDASPAGAVKAPRG
jgi:hypothetical protein